MKRIYKSSLFNGLSPKEVDDLIVEYGILRTYQAGEAIGRQGDPCRYLRVIDEGEVRGEMISPAGERITIEEIEAPRPIAPAFVFASDNRLPVDIVCRTRVSLVAFTESDFVEIIRRHEPVLRNYLRLMSDRSRFLSDRLRMIRFGTIRSKLANYLFEQRDLKQNDVFAISHTQNELADIFGVTRPALAREIGILVKEGIIGSARSRYSILDPMRLQKII